LGTCVIARHEDSKGCTLVIGRSCVHMPKKNEQTTSDGKRVRDHVRKVLAKLAALQKQTRAQTKVSL
jgi:hypothetical protein